MVGGMRGQVNKSHGVGAIPTGGWRKKSPVAHWPPIPRSLRASVPSIQRPVLPATRALTQTGRSDTPTMLVEGIREEGAGRVRGDEGTVLDREREAMTRPPLVRHHW